MSRVIQKLDVGDRAPNFVLPDQGGSLTMFYERTRGLPVALVFLRGPRCPWSGPILERLKGLSGEFEAAGCELFVVALDTATEGSAADLPFLLWSDPKGKITEGYLGRLGVTAAPEGTGAAVAVLLDPNQRILAVHRSQGPDLADTLLSACRDLERPEEAETRVQSAPVLIVPQVLDTGLCRDVVAYGRRAKASPTVIVEDPALRNLLVGLIGRRLASELYKAFGFQGFRLGALELLDHPEAPAAGTWGGTEQRRFEVVLALQADITAGGELLFPEFGDHRYRLRQGAAAVFSTDLICRPLAYRGEGPFCLRTYLEAARPPGS